MTSYFGYEVDFIEPCIPIWDIDSVDDQLRYIENRTIYLLYKHKRLDDITQDVADLIQMYTNLLVKIAPDLVGNAIDDYLDKALAHAISQGAVPKSDGVRL